ncbi:DUF6153 family protein [Streptomyces sp. G-G2]|uniref:DUF6153 family protein n=1 Tax=Streptomyces sp. G-G2 TaxID=3046201 RepID=UPI0024B95B2A|nr:DUF6153 family protein [Streptomyces sp. G-G2]MDJ0383192.1 DUF6153 family protein [Streptomyces sp. G-G2]
MTTAAQPSGRRPAGRGLVLLVLAVLAGVLAMHGLGPRPAAAAMPADGGGRAMVMTQEASVHPAGGDCSHTAGGSDHLNHADGTCVAAGVGAPYVPPALAAALDVAPSVAAVPGGVATVTEAGRAPPDLSELQLLRI